MITLDDHLLPDLRDTMAPHLRRYPEHRPYAETLRGWFAGRYHGLELETSENLHLFITEIATPDFPTGIPEELLQQFETFRIRLWKRLKDFPDIVDALRDLPGGDVLDAATLRRRRRVEAEEQRLYIEQMAEQYMGLLSAVSPAALASGMIGGEILTEEHRATFQGMLNAFLEADPSIGAGGGNGRFLNYDPQILSLQNIREYVEKVLRRVVYTHLQNHDVDTLAGRQQTFAHIRQHAETALNALATLAGISPRRRQEHAPLFESIVQFFEDIKHLQEVEIPALGCFVDQLPDYNGDMHPFLSLRQLFAVRSLFPRKAEDEEDVPRLYVAFQPGDGKTPVFFVVRELRKRRRRRQGRPEETIIFVTPTRTIFDIARQLSTGLDVNGDQIPGFAQRQFYLSGQAPPIGLIHSGIPPRDRPVKFVNAFQNARIILCTQSMLDTQLLGREVVDHLEGIPDTIVNVDEFPVAEGSGGEDSKLGRRLLRRANVRGGYCGTPTSPGGIETLDLNLHMLEHICPDLDPPSIGNPASIENVMGPGDTRKYEGVVVEGTDKTRLRCKRLLALDPPRDYSKFWRFENLPCPPGSPIHTVLQAVVDGRGTFWQKYHPYTLLARAPWLRDPQATSPMLDRTQELIHDNIAQCRVILVIEEDHKEGILRRHPQYPSRDSFADRLRNFIGGLNVGGVPVEFETVYGGMDENVVDGIRQRTRTGADGTTAPIVVFIHRQCLSPGTDWSGAELVIRLGPSFHLQTQEQELCRTLRAGHVTPRMVTLYLEETLEAVKLLIAQNRYNQETRLVYGDVISAQRMHELEMSEQEAVESGRMGSLESHEDQWNRLAGDLHNGGARKMTDRWKEKDKEWRHWHMDITDRSGLDPANLQRLAASVVSSVSGGNILEIGGGGMIATHLHRIAPNADRKVHSLDPHPYMHAAGADLAMREGVPEIPRALPSGTAMDVRYLLAERELEPDGIDCMVLHGLQNYRTEDRARIFIHARRAAKKLVMPIPFTACKPNEFQSILRNLPPCGWRVVQSWTGPVESRDGTGEPPVRGYLVVAEQTEGPAPREESVLPRISPTALQMTHADTWGRVLRQRHDDERDLRVLPYPTIATIFEVQNGNTMRYESPLSYRDVQLDHRKQICDAVLLIRNLAADGLSWHGLPAADREQVENDRGIVFAHGLQNPSFFLRGFPQHTFYPYEAVWEQLLGLPSSGS